MTLEAGGTRFDAVILQRDGSRRTIAAVRLPMPGRHNVQNALAAIAVAVELGISDDKIVEGFERFEGVKRRFTRVGEVGGAIIIDDYAHHPVEIRAVLSAARESAQGHSEDGDDATGGRVIAVMQPHRFSRLEALMDDFQSAFNDADIVLVAPVYSAGEAPIDGVDSTALVYAFGPRDPWSSGRDLADLRNFARHRRGSRVIVAWGRRLRMGVWWP